jgi:protein-S-isoprenylcysteine O-methyltransferase Ste14
LKDPHSHGFYRFFVFEFIALLILYQILGWLRNPWEWNQIISWILLLISIPYLIIGVYLLRKLGKSAKVSLNSELNDTKNLFQFEKTTQLVTTGLYRYIRHPLYASLLFLGWGAFFKSIDQNSIVLIILITFFLLATAIADEHECIARFGKIYREYMKKTKRFIPLLF